MTSLLDGEFNEDEIQNIVQAHLNKYGAITRRGGGMCGQVFFFDQGDRVHPRWIVAKIPRKPHKDRNERNKRFIREIEIQHKTFRHTFVCWPADYFMILDTPVAVYRAADGDLAEIIPSCSFSLESRLSFLVYLCSGLSHCHSAGVDCHQDLKPQNILVRNMRNITDNLPKEDVFLFPQIADFGLANIGRDFNQPLGSKPYMSPEQWLNGIVSSKSDIFALGVIIFETITRGLHPMGGVIREWWPDPLEKHSRKWLRDDTWERWARNGVPITFPEGLNEHLKEVVVCCLAPDPQMRPTLDTIRTQLLKILSSYNPTAGMQARVQADLADNDQTDYRWPYRDHRLDLLRNAVENI